ncbi:MAG: hypothetical protein HAW63_02135 [Bdellovibrionaceae bacterium]|nr:hypothetical protein [Pseudobdellovibrionaceae bacterium]
MSFFTNTNRFSVLIVTVLFSTTFLMSSSFAFNFYSSPALQKSFKNVQQRYEIANTQPWNVLALLPSEQLKQLKKRFTLQLAKLFPTSKYKTCKNKKPILACFLKRQQAYRDARKLLFGKLHLKGHSKNTYSIDGIYCSKTFTNKDFKKSYLGPNQIPSPSVLNTEHIWPQSRFTHQFSRTIQKTDLHILYPADAPTNSQRSNHPFGEVVNSVSKSCGTAKLGLTKNSSKTHFEPPHNYKGNVARAMLYFSLRYQMPLSKEKRKMFNRWSQLDPVDAFEKQRNEAIFAINQTRNPFIDQPESILYISDSWGN